VSTHASHGAATASGTSITYTPTTGYSGPDTFQYSATNAIGTSAPAAVSITISLPPPVANTVSQTVGYNSTNNAITLNITGGAASSVAVPTQIAHGEADSQRDIDHLNADEWLLRNRHVDARGHEYQRRLARGNRKPYWRA